MKHTVYIYKERQYCNTRPVAYPYMPSESTMRFYRKFSRNNMARVECEIKTNRPHHSPNHHMEK